MSERAKELFRNHCETIIGQYGDLRHQASKIAGVYKECDGSSLEWFCESINFETDQEYIEAELVAYSCGSTCNDTVNLPIDWFLMTEAEVEQAIFEHFRKKQAEAAERKQREAEAQEVAKREERRKQYLQMKQEFEGEL